MNFVLDASIAASWAFPDENSPIATRAFEQLRDGALAHVPSLWWFELRDTLVVGERRGRLTEDDTESFLSSLNAFDIRVDGVPSDHAVLHLARRHRLTVYDAAYLALAGSRRAPLATLDKQLATAAHVDGLALFA